MRFFDNKNILFKFIVFLFITVTGSALLVTLQVTGKDVSNVEKIVLKYEENDAFSIESYIDCLYDVNKDISNKCIESEIQSLIDKGKASEVLHLIKALDENKGNFIVNCDYLAERIGKVFNNITDLGSLLIIDFSYCNYGFQMGVFGEIDEGFLTDKNMIKVVKEACSTYISDEGYKDSESSACYEGIANILTTIPRDLDPLGSRDFCLSIGDPEGACVNMLLKNYMHVGSSKLSKDLFADKESVVETLLNYCKSEAGDNTKICLANVIANILIHNEKLVYLVADYCSKVKLDLSKRCYREIANGFNLATESAFIKENSELGKVGERVFIDRYDKVTYLPQILKIFTENQPKYCNFLENVVGLSKEYVDQCYIGYALVLLEYYNIEDAKLCTYFNKNKYELCKIGIKINNGKSIEAKYKI